MTVMPLSGGELGICESRGERADDGGRMKGGQFQDNYASSAICRALSGLREQCSERRMRLLPDHDRALIFNYHDRVLVDAAGAHFHHALTRPRIRLAHADHLGFGIERITRKDRMRELDIIPPKRKSVLAQVGNA